MKLKYIVKLSLVCGVMSTAVALSGCNSSKAVQANAAAVSTDNESASAVVSGSSGVPVSSDLVSHSAPSVSSAVLVSGKPSTGSNSTSHQAPAIKSNSGGVTRTTSAAPRPASTKPASRTVSTAPTPRPTSTAPSTGVSAKFFGANYGCESASEYSYVLKKAEAVKGSSKYNSSYATYKKHASSFESLWGIAYSDTWNDIVSIESYFGSVGTGSASVGSAYDYYTGANTVCSDTAKALEAALHVNGYNARLAAGGNHMWVQVNVDGSWYNIEKTISTSTPSGYTLSSTGYNL